MATIRTRLHPFHDVAEHDQISLYSLDQTGLAGQLVKIATGSANPQSTETDKFISTSVGASYNRTSSTRYETTWKVSPTVSGDTKYTAVGFTKLSTLEYDENGLPLKLFPERAKQIGCVVSGETVPVITAGLIGIWGNYIDQSTSPVQPGFAVCISRSGNGFVASVDQTKAAAFRAVTNTGIAVYDETTVIGKWLSSLPTSPNTGIANEFSAQGGYAFLSFDLKR